MLELENNNNQQEIIINDEIITFKKGDTLRDLKDKLENLDYKFQLVYAMEVYRYKTKTLPRRIDIAVGNSIPLSYGEIQEMFLDVPIFKIDLQESHSGSALVFLNNFFNNVTHNIMTITLEKMDLADTTTPRIYTQGWKSIYR